MKTNFISPDGVFILKTQTPIDCPYSENPDGFSWCKNVGLFVDPKTLPPRATGKNGGFFGTANGRQYTFPVEFSLSAIEVKKEHDPEFDTVLEIPEKLGGGFVLNRPGCPSSIAKMIKEATL